MSPIQANPLIRKLHHLFPLTREEEQVLDNACSRTAHFGSDEDIAVEGDRPSDCNLLLSGIVCRYKIVLDGKRQIMSFHCAGDVFDAQSFILETMDHSIGTLTDCSVGVIPHGTMLEITEGFPRIARAIWKDTLVDAAIFREWMTNIGRRSAYARIAHLLCEQYVKLKTVGLTKDHEFPWPITQGEIGDALGLSNVHVSRTVKELRKADLVAFKAGWLTINDWEGLKAAGEFDPGYLHLRPAEGAARKSDGHDRSPEPLI
ncbi:MAG TPA: Crp/Fnr family transcriptional regulator [Woeseiaceae bacterium]|nr:Crp/Fnr family transcriptional regulator [Woeseiaceae bacterium]